MRHAKWLPVALGLLLCACAANNYTPIQQAKLQAKAYTEIYFSLYSVVVQAEADQNLNPKVKKVLYRKVNPAMNALKETIIAYTKAVQAAENGESQQIWQAALYKVRIEKLLNYLLPLVNDLKEAL